ncbi:MAG: hypothetical protein J6M53_05625 [Bacteroidaceae bacterium]|nr:hypothetical protein [Bacteroidaceae bacterium]
MKGREVPAGANPCAACRYVRHTIRGLWCTLDKTLREYRPAIDCPQGAALG